MYSLKMQYDLIQAFSDKLFFTIQDVASAGGITVPSARILCVRYTRRGIFLRLKKNFYVLAQRWRQYSRDQFMMVANFLQVPSYISCMTALAFHEITTQVQQGFFESVSLKRSVRYAAGGIAFAYYKIKQPCYFDFVKSNGVFIATPEKACTDMLYLYSFGKYAFDASSLDLSKLDLQKLRQLLQAFPEKTRATARHLCGI